MFYFIFCTATVKINQAYLIFLSQSGEKFLTLLELRKLVIYWHFQDKQHIYTTYQSTFPFIALNGQYIVNYLLVVLKFGEQ